MRFYFSLALSSLILCGVLAGGLWSWTGPLAIFIVHPLLDLLMGEEKIQNHLPQQTFFSRIYIFLTVIFLTIFWWLSLHQFLESDSSAESAGILVSTGLVMGYMGITTAHELVHRQQALTQLSGYWILWHVFFGHWAVEHVFGHHKNVGTPLDPATAQKNEWLYPYWIKSFFGGLRSSFNLEKNRLKHRTFWQKIFFNRVLMSTVIQLTFAFELYAFFGSQGVQFYLLQSLVAICLLQTVDYIEHYSLQRKEREPGVYEPVRAEHSWDTQYLLTNSTLLNLGYHSHHHRKPNVHYTDLSTEVGVRKMPYGYSLMVIFALVPPLYFRVMARSSAGPDFR